MKPFGNSSDIDLLVVYDSNEILEKAKECLEGVSSIFPLDIVYMLPQEESRFDFVRKQKAILILDMNANDGNSPSTKCGT